MTALDGHAEDPPYAMPIPPPAGIESFSHVTTLGLGLLETRQDCGRRFGEAEPCARGKTLDGLRASLPEKRGRRK